MILVRSFEADEWPVWRTLRLQALAESPDSFCETLSDAGLRPDAEWVDATAARGAAERNVLLAEEDGEAAGMAVIVVTPADPSHAELFAMWVAPAARRHGAGRALVQAAIAWAASHGVREVTLRVAEPNRPAIRLYREIGFVDAGEGGALRAGSAVATRVMRIRLPRGG